MSHRHGEEFYKKGSSSSSSRDYRSHRSRSPLDEGSRGDRVRERSKERSSDSRREDYNDRGRDRERDHHVRSRDRSRDDTTRSRSRRHSDSSSESSDTDSSKNDSKSADIPAPPPPPRISKVSMTLKPPAVQMKLGSFKMGSAKPVAPPIVKPAGVASIFNQDSEDEEEEMPSEARMRMRNIGRETPTSAGPNSFGKTKQGFCDSKKIFEKNLRAAMEKD